ncbi:hypothetical protein, partial [Herbinix luporum]|uniref:hypothetical protein n=1 Tax=Herbinix luporum TaxID=1679721 RepID=UPI002ED3046B
IEESTNQAVNTPVVPTEKAVEKPVEKSEEKAEEKPEIEMTEIEISTSKYVLLAPKADVLIPAGFEKTEATIMDKKLSVWKPVESKENGFYLIYAMNNAGIKGWYLFDTEEETIQRFAEDLYSRNKEDESVTAFLQNSTNILNATDIKDKTESGRKSQIISFIIALLVITVSAVIVYIRKKQYR